MAVYSHSRIQTFEQCPYKYRLKYIDRIKVDVPTTIEAFMGAQVHSALEYLYRKAMYGTHLTKDEFLDQYDRLWENHYSDTILIVSKELTAPEYKDRGASLLSTYYDQFFPKREFQTIAVETQDRLKLTNGHYYHIRIDRLGRNPDGTYFICDYKTNNSLKTQEELDSDRQLTMYAQWAQHRFRDAKDIRLRWYFLTFNTALDSKRSSVQLDKVQQETEQQINQIEQTTSFPINTSRLCSWCVYQHICPAWSHLFEREQKTIHTYTTTESGKDLVEEYASLAEQKKEIERQMTSLKEKIDEFARAHSLTALFGTQHKISLSYRPSYKLKEKEYETEVRKILENADQLDSHMTLNTLRLTSSLQNNAFSDETTKALMAYLEKSESVHLSVSSFDPTSMNSLQK